MSCTNGSLVPKEQYGRTLCKDGTQDFVAKPNSTFLLGLYPRCTIAARNFRSDSVCVKDGRSGERMDTAYGSWIGQPVVLQVALGDIKVPLRGKLLKDGAETVRMRIGEGWDVDIYKTMILAVEEDVMGLVPA